MILVLVGLVAVAALLVCEWNESKLGIAVSKLTASTCFVAFALTLGAMNSTYGQILLAGLILCWIGDALLLSSGQSTAFQLGIGAFLLGHLAYVAAFFELGIDWMGLLAGGLLMSGGALAALSWLRPHLPDDFKGAVLAYITVISLMVATSVAVVAAGGSLIIAIGAIGFMLSDVAVARQRFVTPSFVNSAWGLPLYFGSQMLLAGSVALPPIN